MDQTENFQQILYNLNNNNKNLIDNINNNKKINKFNDKCRQFSLKLREFVSSITCMRDYIKANAKDYVNILSSILSISSQMTDDERDQIDKDVQDFIKLANDVIKILRVELKSITLKQQYEHEMNAINMTELYLNSIYEIHNKNKALRLRRKLYTQQFFRIDKTIINNNNNYNGNNEINDNQIIKKLKNQKNLKQFDNDSVKNNNKNKIFKIYNDYNDSILNETMENNYLQLAPEEQKQFQLEGKQIYDQLNSMNDEVINITKKISEIARLQELFSENVLKQECDLNNLNISTITSNESILDGNEQLREAMRKNAGFRVWILFFITTLAFVILFLDWYNP